MSISDYVLSQFPAIYEKYPDKITKSVVNTHYYHDTRYIKHSVDEKCETIVEVWNMDTIKTGEKLQEEGFNPVLMNMASSFKAGGGWRKGAMAQEESLFYQSTYAISLEDCLNLNKHRKWRYPLSPYTIIYSPNVLVFNDITKDGVSTRKWKDCKWLDFIAVSAIRRPHLVKGVLSDVDREMTKEKIRGFFKVALEKKHDSLVLGAFGCGAYGNNPEDISEIFEEIIKEFKGLFKKIVFGIIEDKNSRNNNLKPFQKRFS